MIHLPFTPTGWADAPLACPCCDNDNLHHESVEVFERTTEDAETGIHVTVEGVARFDTDMAGNPSRRRDGLLIRYSCEHCTATPAMAIAQHKGTTFLYWIPGSEVGAPL